MEREKEETVKAMTDVRGVRRGKCCACQCKGFTAQEGKVTCTNCNHPPAKHENLDTKLESDGLEGVKATRRPEIVFDDDDGMDSEDDCVVICSITSCQSPAYLDANTGESSLYCVKHKDQPQG